MEADERLLSEPATPGTPGPSKRILSPNKTTPRGRPRKFSSSQMARREGRLNLVTVVPDELFGQNVIKDSLPKPRFMEPQRKKEQWEQMDLGKAAITSVESPGKTSDTNNLTNQQVVTPRTTRGCNLLFRQALSTPRRKYKLKRGKKAVENMINQPRISQLLSPVNRKPLNKQ